MKPTSCADNTLLKYLPRKTLAKLAPCFEQVSLEAGQVLYEAGETRTHAYFPTTGIVSIIQMLEGGASSEIALIGRHGMVGITTILGGSSQPNRVMVQSPGQAFRIPAEVLGREMRKGGALMTVLLLYVQVLYTQVAQSAVCNRHHNLQRQLCRWLLLSLDCIDGDELKVTQELIAGILGVRREGITRAAGHLQSMHIIEYRRGAIKVLDRARLEETSCECYWIIKSESQRLQALQASL